MMILKHVKNILLLLLLTIKISITSELIEERTSKNLINYFSGKIRTCRMPLSLLNELNRDHSLKNLFSVDDKLYLFKFKNELFIIDTTQIEIAQKKLVLHEEILYKLLLKKLYMNPKIPLINKSIGMKCLEIVHSLPDQVIDSIDNTHTLNSLSLRIINLMY